MILLLGGGLRAVFAVYAMFWVVLLIVLYFGVGALMKKAERGAGHGHGEPGGKR